MLKTNFWATVVYAGVILGIWPSAAFAYILSRLLGSSQLVFMVAHPVFWALCRLVIGWSFHRFLWRGRKRRPANR